MAKLKKPKAHEEESQSSSKSDPRKLDILNSSTVKSFPTMTAAVAAVVAVVVDCYGFETPA